MAKGRFPASGDVGEKAVAEYEELLSRVAAPVTDDEARKLTGLFGPDDFFGMAWTVLHLIESAPGWPIRDCLRDLGNRWIETLRDRANA